MPGKRSAKSKKPCKKVKKNKIKSSIISNNEKTSDIPKSVLKMEDVVEKIFSFLDYETLSTVQLVSKLWMEKVHQRLLKNYSPFCLNVPVLYCQDNKHLLHQQEDCIKKNVIINKLFNSSPKNLAIIFTDGQFPREYHQVEICTSDNLDNVADDYLKFLPDNSIAVQEFIYVNDIQIKGELNLMTALFFPKIPSIEIRTSVITASSMYDYFDSFEVIEDLFNLDDPKREEKENCLLIFGLNYKYCQRRRSTRIINEILNDIKNQSNLDKITVWGGAHLEIRHRDIEPHLELIQWHIFNIIGIKSYSITLSFDLSEEAYKQKLKDFKKKIIFKQNLFALAITHTKESKKEKLDRIMKKVLWFIDILNIRLTTILSYVEDYSCEPIIFCNKSDNANLKINNKDHNTVAYLIIST